MSDSEDEAVEKQLKIVVVGEAGTGKVKNSVYSHFGGLSLQQPNRVKWSF
jgi:hypothetical protein